MTCDVWRVTCDTCVGYEVLRVEEILGRRVTVRSAAALLDRALVSLQILLALQDCHIFAMVSNYHALYLRQ